MFNETRVILLFSRPDRASHSVVNRRVKHLNLKNKIHFFHVIDEFFIVAVSILKMVDLNGTAPLTHNYQLWALLLS